jgi:hypothetical protein
MTPSPPGRYRRPPLVPPGIAARRHPGGRTCDLFGCHHLRERGFWDQKGAGVLPGPRGAPASAGFPISLPASGDDTDTMLRDLLGSSPEDIAALRQSVAGLIADPIGLARSQNTAAPVILGVMFRLCRYAEVSMRGGPQGRPDIGLSSTRYQTRPACPIRLSDSTPKSHSPPQRSFGLGRLCRHPFYVATLSQGIAGNVWKSAEILSLTCDTLRHKKAAIRGLFWS